MRLIVQRLDAGIGGRVAIFMGGLGIGGICSAAAPSTSARWSSTRPRALCVAASAAATPFALVIVRAIYVSPAVAPPRSRRCDVLRLVLAALVLRTHGAHGRRAARRRARSPRRRSRRRRLAVLSCMNTLGAVTGSLLATFCCWRCSARYALERVPRDALVALTARSIARHRPLDHAEEQSRVRRPRPRRSCSRPPPVVGSPSS
jgi:hypothetical protein